MTPETRRRILQSKTFKTFLTLLAFMALGMALNKITYALYDSYQDLAERISMAFVGLGGMVSAVFMTKWLVEEAIGTTDIPWWKLLFKYGKECFVRYRAIRALWKEGKTFVDNAKTQSAHDALEADERKERAYTLPTDQPLSINLCTLHNADVLTKLNGHWPAVVALPVIWIAVAIGGLFLLVILTAGLYAAAWWAMNQLRIERDSDSEGRKRVFIDVVAGMSLVACIATLVGEADGIITWAYIYMMAFKDWQGWPKGWIEQHFSGPNAFWPTT